MREIKFRAWDKEDKRMHYDLEFTTSELVNSENEFYKFMQYTGLKDRNWNDIYEGDVVKYFAFKDEWLIADVFCAGSDFAVRGTEGPVCLQNFIHEHEYSGNPIQPIEVLGNIYENPELS